MEAVARAPRRPGGGHPGRLHRRVLGIAPKQSSQSGVLGRAGPARLGSLGSSEQWGEAERGWRHSSAGRTNTSTFCTS